MKELSIFNQEAEVGLEDDDPLPDMSMVKGAGVDFEQGKRNVEEWVSRFGGITLRMKVSPEDDPSLGFTTVAFLGMVKIGGQDLAIIMDAWNNGSLRLMDEQSLLNLIDENDNNPFGQQTEAVKPWIKLFEEIDRRGIKKPKGRKVPGWCGPGSLAIAFELLGVKVGQKKLAKYTHEGWGTFPENMVRVVEEHKFGTSEWQKSSLPEIRNILSENEDKALIVNWSDGEPEEDGHYSVLIAIIDNHVVLLDPACGGEIHILEKEAFDKAWLDIHPATNEPLEKRVLVISNNV